MFGHPSQHGHMMAGVRKAASSPKTPKHLIPHLQKRANAMNVPNTAAKPKMKATSVPKGPTTSNLQQQVVQPSEPFRNPSNPTTAPAGKSMTQDGHKGQPAMLKPKAGPGVSAVGGKPKAKPARPFYGK